MTDRFKIIFLSLTKMRNVSGCLWFNIYFSLAYLLLKNRNLIFCLQNIQIWAFVQILLLLILGFLLLISRVFPGVFHLYIFLEVFQEVSLWLVWSAGLVGQPLSHRLLAWRVRTTLGIFLLSTLICRWFHIDFGCFHFELYIYGSSICENHRELILVPNCLYFKKLITISNFLASEPPVTKYRKSQKISILRIAIPRVTS